MAASRNSKGYIARLSDIEADNPTGDLFIITDNLSSHSSLETRTWLCGHPRIHHVFIPTGACWLNAAQRAGGGSSAVMPWLVRARPLPKRSSKLPASQRLNSTCEPSPGSGDARLRRLVTIGVSSVTAFEEWSTSRLTYNGREGVCSLVPEAFTCLLSLFTGESVCSSERLASWVR